MSVHTVSVPSLTRIGAVETLPVSAFAAQPPARAESRRRVPAERRTWRRWVLVEVCMSVRIHGEGLGEALQGVLGDADQSMLGRLPVACVDADDRHMGRQRQGG